MDLWSPKIKALTSMWVSAYVSRLLEEDSNLQPCG
jgi:hypothetical protein